MNLNVLHFNLWRFVTQRKRAAMITFAVVLELVVLCIVVHKRSFRTPYPKDWEASWTSTNVPDKLLVVAGYMFNTDWLNEYLSHYPHVVYTKMNNTAKYNVPHNVGQEAHMYLQFIIDYYDKLPVHTAFLHGHGEDSWHDATLYERLNNLDWDAKPYQNLNWDWRRWHDLNNKKYIVHKAELTKNWPPPITKWVGSPPPRICHYCCAQFIVHKDTIRMLPKQFYIDYYNWFIETKTDTYWTSRIAEYTWHIIFGQPACELANPLIRAWNYLDNMFR
jgi:hypothetical protein